MTASKSTVQGKRSNASVRVRVSSELHVLLLNVRVDAHVMTVSALYLPELALKSTENLARAHAILVPHRFVLCAQSALRV
jgi:hypothetical protein